MKMSICLITAFTILSGVECLAPPKIQCRDPDAGGTAQNEGRKFVLLGTEHASGAGLGNMLVFYPAMYYFAAFTARDIIVADNSVFGEICKIIVCGFPFASELAAAYPDIITDHELHNPTGIKVRDMQRFMEGQVDYPQHVVTGYGFLSVSDWWVYFNDTVRCVQKITGCDAGDVPCADRHAYQKLIRGPFKSSLTTAEEERILGVPKHIKHAILTLPHAYAPRLDAAIHIRNQFRGFEQLLAINDPVYRAEVDNWLASEEAKTVVTSMEAQLREVISTSRKQRNISTTEPIRVYLACDNEEVKNNFTGYLERPTSGLIPIRVMRVKTDFIQHVKNLDSMKEATNNQGLLDLVFDWYALTLSNVILAWRIDGTSLISTFVHSAQRVSGTTERSDINAPIGNGIGTIGYIFTKNKRGHYSWSKMWIFNFLEDFVLKKR